MPLIRVSIKKICSEIDCSEDILHDSGVLLIYDSLMPANCQITPDIL